MKVAIYARVSTADQSPDLQTHDLVDYCDRRGWKVYAHYVDRGVSGAKDTRPELDELMRHATAKRFDAVLVWKFDRFARSSSHLLEALRHFQSLGIEFISVTEGIDTTTAMGKMVFTFLGAIAEFERSLIIERTRAGVARAKANGVRLGRPRVGFDPDVLIAMRAEVPPKSYRQIAMATGLSLGLVHRVIAEHVKNPQTCDRDFRAINGPRVHQMP